MAVDYGIERFLANRSFIDLPPTTVSFLRVSKLKLTGLDALHRTCNMALGLNSKTREVDVRMCLGAPALSVAGIAKGKVAMVPVTLFPRINIYHLDFEVRVSVKIARGETAKLKLFTIREIKPEMDFQGIGSGMNWIVNLVLKTGFKDKIVDMAVVEIEKGIRQAFQDNPL